MPVELDARKQGVLKAVIQSYIDTAEPVGSQALAHRSRLGVSPATIRHEMSALEELGYLSQPHTSAGRVPTDRGYRFYVNSMMREERVAPTDRVRIRRRFLALQDDPQRVPEEVARTLARTTNYASVVAQPRPDDLVFKHLHFIPLTSTRVLAVIVTDAAVLEAKIVDLRDSLEPEELDHLARSVSRRLEGRTLGEISDEALAKAVDEAAWQQRILHQLAEWLHRQMATGSERRVHIEGTANILKQPEFQDARLARPVLSALEREDVVVELLRPGSSGAGRRGSPDEQVWITIGSEHQIEDLRGCSVVAAAYRFGGRPAGALGIVGPTRMEYARVISLVRYLAESLSQMFAESS